MIKKGLLALQLRCVIHGVVYLVSKPGGLLMGSEMPLNMVYSWLHLHSIPSAACSAATVADTHCQQWAVLLSVQLSGREEQGGKPYLLKEKWESPNRLKRWSLHNVPRGFLCEEWISRGFPSCPSPEVFAQW